MTPSLPRSAWIDYLLRVAQPPLASLAAGRFRAEFPVQARPEKAADRAKYTHLEALGRTLAGIAPWLELTHTPAEEVECQARLRALATGAIAQALDPASPDAIDFTAGGQCLVDAAFLAHALLRAPETLFNALDTTSRDRLIAALRATRMHTPGTNNWLLFSAMVEAALLRFTGEADFMRIDYAIRQHEQWYKGDGIYGDGADFHWDYYNSFVIQPMLLDVAETADAVSDRWRALLPAIRRRALRHAAVLERLVGSDGSFPPIGRSIAYRCGAFQHLAQMALRRELPEGLAPAAVRGALGAVIHRTLSAPGTFDAGGWLRIGLAGDQPDLAEAYISTGSLYLCSTAFLPLGLPADDPFWSSPDTPWTSVRVWRGEDMPADRALYA
ncbi:MAG: DUF2264 domain-containing protein [Opitutaceae bacterium]|jgi:hypothetical protein|nr:DUF2264 domain-containing protein [Opitutaceae bacterium]